MSHLSPPASDEFDPYYAGYVARVANLTTPFDELVAQPAPNIHVSMPSTVLQKTIITDANTLIMIIGSSGTSWPAALITSRCTRSESAKNRTPAAYPAATRVTINRARDSGNESVYGAARTGKVAPPPQPPSETSMMCRPLPARTRTASSTR